METDFEFLCVYNTNLHTLSHRFRDMADYWSNFQCRQGVSLFNALVRVEFLNSGSRNLAPGN